jgi:oligopeptide transport system ATP-binding protein
VRGLVKRFSARSGLLGGREGAELTAVDGVDLTVGSGETLGLVGESGSGKSTLCRAILRLVEPDEGTVRFEGAELTGLGRRELRSIRGRIQMIFQDPQASLNPRKRVGEIVAAPLRIHGIASGAQLQREVGELFDRVGLSPEHRNRYPHEFSGGQRQRIGIARALATRPKLILADEPVSALDVSIRAQIVNLLADLQSEMGLSYLFVAHDIGIVRHVSDRIAVMHEGRIVETGPAEQVCERPRDPYTRALLASVPIPDPREARARRGGGGATPGTGGSSSRATPEGPDR